MKNGEQDRTASACHIDLYLYKQMPFDSTSRPATFHRTTHVVLLDFGSETFPLYVENVNGFLDAVEKNLEHVNKLLHILYSAHFLL